MVNRYTKLRWRRKIRRQQKSLEEASENVGKGFDKHIVNRWRNLKEVRRFVLGWLVLIALLIGGVTMQSRDLNQFYLTEVPTSGGTYREGLVGNITDLNPIFAATAADRAAASLIFSSLLKYDENNELVGDLAQSWSVNKNGLIYRLVLKDNIKWHDGEDLTAEDVVFTYNLVQHPDTRSFLNSSWRDVKIQAKSDRVVIFTLPNEFSPFPQSLTVGAILPEHILGGIEPGQVRGLPFNTTEPVGTGPFVYEELSSIDRTTSLLRMSANEDYFLGRPELDAFIIKTFDDREELVAEFINGELVGASGLSTPDQDLILNYDDGEWYDMQLNNAVYVFLKNSNGLLSDVDVRRGLQRATNQKEIARMLESRYSLAKGPLLPNQLGYQEDNVQPNYSLTRANKILDEAGWKLGPDGVRVKGERRLSVDLVTQNSDDYERVARKIREQWRKAGVNTNVLIVSESEIQQNHIVPHNYQSLLFGITLGSDPDVFPYWHSSQSGVGGFNLSEYKNKLADESLESGRSRQDEAIRAEKYKAFTQFWQEDVPAIALYQPAYSYAQRSNVSNFGTFRINTPDDRFTNVHKWQINTTLGEKVY